MYYEHSVIRNSVIRKLGFKKANFSSHLLKNSDIRNRSKKLKVHFQEKLGNKKPKVHFQQKNSDIRNRKYISTVPPRSANGTGCDPFLRTEKESGENRKRCCKVTMAEKSRHTLPLKKKIEIIDYVEKNYENRDKQLSLSCMSLLLRFPKSERTIRNTCSNMKAEK